MKTTCFGSRAVTAAVVLLTVAAIACEDSTQPQDENIFFPATAVDAAPSTWGTLGAVTITGGYGSGLATDPADLRTFYILTDRGPNTMTPVANQLLFPIPSFTPNIGKFVLQGDSLRRIATIELKTAAGVKLTGLPNPAGQGATGETAITTGGAVLAPDPEGIDSEGLAIASDGTFWVSDEYGPHIVHFDATGRTIERINPYGSGTGGRKLPLVFARRRANRGMEGLALTPDGTTIVGIMQSPLDNPTPAIGRASAVNRIVTFNIASGATREYVYLTDAVGFYASDIVALTNTTFLVDERDAALPGDAAAPATQKRIYKIDLNGATDVTDPANSASGKMFGGKALEALTTAERQAAGIVPVSKSLVYDLLTLPGRYPHDKFEGLAFSRDGKTLFIANDDDFGVIDNGAGGMMNKILPMTQKQDRLVMYFITLSQSLK